MRMGTMAPFKCPNCRREFPRKIQFDRHLERKTPCSPDEYDQCLKCNRQFYMKKEYLEHVKLCNGAEYEALTRSDTEPVVVKKIGRLHQRGTVRRVSTGSRVRQEILRV